MAIFNSRNIPGFATLTPSRREALLILCDNAVKADKDWVVDGPDTMLRPLGGSAAFKVADLVKKGFIELIGRVPSTNGGYRTMKRYRFKFSFGLKPSPVMTIKYGKSSVVVSAFEGKQILSIHSGTEDKPTLKITLEIVHEQIS